VEGTDTKSESMGRCSPDTPSGQRAYQLKASYQGLIRCATGQARHLQTPKDSQTSSTELVQKIARSRHPATIGQLAQMLMSESSIGEEDFVQIVKKMAGDGSLVLDQPVHEIESPWDYLLTPTISLWFWVALGVTVLAVTVVLFIPDFFPVVVIRWGLGSVLVLFLPGYALLQLLFPKPSEMDSLERFALDIGLSLALVPLIGLVLNYTPWGIRFIPVTASISAFTITFLVAAAARKYVYMRERAAIR